MMSSSNSYSSNQNRSDLCYCGLPARIRTSNTLDNPGRRFRSSGPKCSFWEWIDPEPVVMKIKIQKEVDDVKAELQNYMLTVEDLRKEDMDLLNCSSFKLHYQVLRSSGVPTVLTDYLRTVPLPLLPPGEQVNQGNIPEPELAPEPQPMDVDPEASVAIPDQEVANPQPLTTVEEPLEDPNETINEPPSPPIPNIQTSVSVEGDSALAAAHKEIHPSTAALPSSKRGRTETEATVDTLFQTSKAPFIDFSDGDWATLTKAISEPIAQSSKEELTEATGVPTILRLGSLVEGSKNQESSQTSREGFDLNAQSKRSLSTSPDGTYLDPADPSKDISSTDDQQLGLTKDGDLRSPIAPPVTSLRTATVFSSAGTTSKKGLSETKTLTHLA
ncbi:hypothetical protein POM88_016958 [Heracleum sosnowskyi]|uniref:Uncharacterized protein n=1 Tax=Heracleum sosnowskyi TaxID=360622 RepID=A0AAD8IRP1_9APIA|nr:hypothetical protein POM88_016958 [Heracleum sosnowskyi]